MTSTLSSAAAQLIHTARTPALTNNLKVITQLPFGFYPAHTRGVHNAAVHPNTLRAIEIPNSLAKLFAEEAKEYIEHETRLLAEQKDIFGKQSILNDPMREKAPIKLFKNAFLKWQKTSKTEPSHNEATSFIKNVNDFRKRKFPALLISGLPTKEIPLAGKSISSSLGFSLYDEEPDFRYNKLLHKMALYGLGFQYEEYGRTILASQNNEVLNWHTDNASRIYKPEITSLLCHNPGTCITRIINPRTLFNSLSEASRDELLKRQYRYNSQGADSCYELFAPFIKSGKNIIFEYADFDDTKIRAETTSAENALQELRTKLKGFFHEKNSTANITLDKTGALLAHIMMYHTCANQEAENKNKIGL